MNYGNAVSVALFKSLPYDIERDFTPVSPMGFFDILVLVNKGSPLWRQGARRRLECGARQDQRRHGQHRQRPARHELFCDREYG
jgi:hypothetical protein